MLTCSILWSTVPCICFRKSTSCPECINLVDLKEEGCVYVCACWVTQSCLPLCNPMDCGPPGSSVHGFLQERILECVAISFSRGFSRPRDQTWVSCILGRFLTVWATWKTIKSDRLCDFPGVYFYYNYADKIQFYQVILTTEGFSVNTIGIWEAGGRNPIQAAWVKGGCHKNRVVM